MVRRITCVWAAVVLFSITGATLFFFASFPVMTDESIALNHLTQNICCVAIHKKDAVIAFGGTGGTIFLYKNEEIQEKSVGRGQLRGLAFSHSGDNLNYAIENRIGTISLANLSHLEFEIAEGKGKEVISNIVQLDDDKFCLSVGDRGKQESTLVCIDLAKKEISRRKQFDSTISMISWHPDRRHLLTRGDHVPIRIVDSGSFEIVQEIKGTSIGMPLIATSHNANSFLYATWDLGINVLRSGTMPDMVLKYDALTGVVDENFQVRPKSPLGLSCLDWSAFTGHMALGLSDSSKGEFIIADELGHTAVRKKMPSSLGALCFFNLERKVVLAGGQGLSGTFAIVEY